MLPLLLGAVVGGLIIKNTTDYPAEIRALRKQMSAEERSAFISDYKKLPKETKTQFKQYLREANMAEAGKLIGRDLSAYKMPVKAKPETESVSDATLANTNVVPITTRIQNILNTYSDGIDSGQVAEAAKRYDNIAGWGSMNIKERTDKLLNVQG